MHTVRGLFLELHSERRFSAAGGAHDRAAPLHGRAGFRSRAARAVARALSFGCLLVMADVVLTGCSHFRTMDDCREIVAITDPTLETIGKLYREGPRDATAWDQIRNEYGNINRKLEAMHASDPKLDQMRSEYVNLLNRTAGFCKTTSDSLRNDDGQQLQIAMSQLRQIASEHKRLAGRITRHCQP